MDLFLSSDTSICSTKAFSLFGNSDHVIISVSIGFPSNAKWDAPFHFINYDYSHADGYGLRDHWRDIPCENVCKFGASTAASEIYEWFQVGIDVYIPDCEYQVKPYSYPWFAAASTAAILHRNHFFVCTNGINPLNLKESTDRLVIVTKEILKLPNLHMLIKQESLSHPRNLTPRTFGRF